jgi:hypothetical protein
MIVVLLEMMRQQKIMFVLELEQGQSCKIPPALSQKKLPQSFRYYDPLVRITQNFASEAKREFLNMQTNLVRFFDK